MDQDLFDRRRAIERERVGSESPAGVVTADIRASWERCRTVLEIERPNVPVDDGDVIEAWDGSPVRRLPPQILTQLVDSGRDAGMLTVVTDPAGQVLWASAPPVLERGAQHVGLVPGGRWDESVAGTNGIAMALVTDRPAAVFATEHWCEPVHDWVCYSAPVHDASGEIAAVIDLSTTWDRANPLALGTVGAMARLMELELVTMTSVAPGLDVRALGPRPRHARRRARRPRTAPGRAAPRARRRRYGHARRAARPAVRRPPDQHDHAAGRDLPHPRRRCAA